MLKENDSAPDFTLPNQNDEQIRLSDFKGKKVVIYFYPKDNTPGCTKEACSIRDVYDDILQKGAVVLGISPDKASAHINFQKKYSLPFHLLSDPDHKAAESFGAWDQKKMFGKIGFGIIRSTFIVNEEGIICKVFPKVSPAEHGKEILKNL